MAVDNVVKMTSLVVEVNVVKVTVLVVVVNVVKVTGLLVVIRPGFLFISIVSFHFI